MKYELHDSQINDILIGENKIVLSFSEGFWELDTNGKEYSQKQNSKIIFKHAITGVAIIIPIIPKKFPNTSNPIIIVIGCNFIVCPMIRG